MVVSASRTGLSVALAIKYFSSMAALPGAMFSIWHNISGSLLASFWRRR
jgi:BASS family bile acid:Na+ symporter